MEKKLQVRSGALTRAFAVVALAILGVGSIAQQARSMPAPPQSRAPLKIDTMDLPDGTVGQPYLGEIQVEGGTLPWAFSATGLPKGLTFGNSDTIHGTPTETGAFTAVVTVTDSAKPPVKASATFKFNVAPAH
jgi:hypothetical protein